MSREIHFPAAALAALAQGRRIEAIKLLREANQGIDAASCTGLPAALRPQ